MPTKGTVNRACSYGHAPVLHACDIGQSPASGIPVSCLLSHVDAGCLQAAKAPHHDISSLEVESSVRLCEHLLYVQRSQRRTFSHLGQHMHHLQRLSTTLAEFQAGAIAPQVGLCFDCKAEIGWCMSPAQIPQTSAHCKVYLSARHDNVRSVQE